MKLSFFIVVCAAVTFSACTKSTIGDDENALTTKSTTQVRPLNNRSGTQKINDQQTNASLERGTPVPLPFFSQETVKVKVGTWITVRFSLQDIYALGPCTGALSDEGRAEIAAATAQFVEDNDIRIVFDGKEIDVAAFFRTEAITIVTNNGGDCQYINPFRYYVNPQAKGDYVLQSWLNGVEYSRIVRFE